MKKEYAIFTKEVIKGCLHQKPFRVEVMARAGGYAMIRRKGCATFVGRENFLSPVADEKSGLVNPSASGGRGR